MSSSARAAVVHGPSARHLLLASLTLIAGLGVWASAAATVFVVPPGPATIQAAMDSAASGDTLLLMPGVFDMALPVSVKGGVSILSQAGPLATVVRRQESQISQGIFFFMNATPPSLLQGVTVARGWEARGWSGGGIYIRDCSPTIRNNLIVANSNGNLEGRNGKGCGIGIDGGAPLIEHNTIVGNYCDLGAIHLYNTSATITRNLICYTGIDSSGTSGFGITCDASPATVSNNLLWGNGLASIGENCLWLGSYTNNVELDPRFCETTRPPEFTLNGDWRVQVSSPVAPGGAYGGWGADLGVCADSTPVHIHSWGRVKVLYRR